MNTETKILAVKDTLEKKGKRLYVRFHSKKQYITGLLLKLDMDDDGNIRCLFSKNGNSKLKGEIIVFALNDLNDVVVFTDENFKPVFLQEFERRE